MAQGPDSPAPGGLEDRGFFGHPRGLSVLFFSELWERFSFYGMRALLVLYMFKGLGYPKDPRAYGIYGAYGALVYAFPILGGWLANKWLGYRRSILLGGLLMALGHFAMAIPHEVAFYGALALLCVGNGFFKPNISSTVGRLYAEEDPRRDRGFTIFYMGINIGAFLAPLVCGFLGETINWHLGFSLAGFGMLLGLGWFLLGQRHIGRHGEPDDPELLRAPVVAGLNRHHLVVLGSFLAVPLIALALWKYDSLKYSVQAVTVVVFAILVVFTFRQTGVARHRMLALIVLMFFHTLFWAGFEQAGSSFTILTYEHIRRDLFGLELTASAFQSVNPAFIVLLAPLFSLLWKRLQTAGWEPSIPMKFALGLFQLGLGFLVLVWGIEAADNFASMALAVIVFVYLLHTMGELCLSPVGLSAVTKLAPQRWVGFCMGAWFLTIANAHLVAAGIAQLTAAAGDEKAAVPEPGAQATAATAPAAEPSAEEKALREVVLAALLPKSETKAVAGELAAANEGERAALVERFSARRAEVLQKFQVDPQAFLGWKETGSAVARLLDETATALAAKQAEAAAQAKEAAPPEAEAPDGETPAGKPSPPNPWEVLPYDTVAAMLGAPPERAHEWREESKTFRKAVVLDLRPDDDDKREKVFGKYDLREESDRARMIEQFKARRLEVLERFQVDPKAFLGWEATRRAALEEVAKARPWQEDAYGAVAEMFGAESEDIVRWREKSLNKYADVFKQVFYVATAAAVLLALLTPLLKRLMHGVT